MVVTAALVAQVLAQTNRILMHIAYGIAFGKELKNKQKLQFPRFFHSPLNDFSCGFHSNREFGKTNSIVSVNSLPYRSKILIVVSKIK